MASLQSCVGLDLESYETLCARSTQMFRKLLRKPDQVRHLLLCARLFWRGPLDALDGAGEFTAAATCARPRVTRCVRDGGLMRPPPPPPSSPPPPLLPPAERYERPGEVLEILQRTLKIADSCMPAQPALFVSILESYVYFFEKRCATVSHAASHPSIHPSIPPPWRSAKALCCARRRPAACGCESPNCLLCVCLAAHPPCACLQVEPVHLSDLLALCREQAEAMKPSA